MSNKGNHSTDIEKTSANDLLLFPDGGQLFYALDSGPFLEETFAYLKDVHLPAGTCPYGRAYEPYGSERDAESILLSYGTIDATTAVYLTHICGVGMTHDALTAYWREQAMPCTITVAYDGLSMEVGEDSVWS